MFGSSWNRICAFSLSHCLWLQFLTLIRPKIGQPARPTNWPKSYSEKNLENISNSYIIDDNLTPFRIHPLISSKIFLLLTKLCSMKGPQICVIRLFSVATKFFNFWVFVWPIAMTFYLFYTNGASKNIKWMKIYSRTLLYRFHWDSRILTFISGSPLKRGEITLKRFNWDQRMLTFIDGSPLKAGPLTRGSNVAKIVSNALSRSGRQSILSL